MQHLAWDSDSVERHLSRCHLSVLNYLFNFISDGGYTCENHGKPKGQQLKGKIVSEFSHFFALFQNFSSRTFPFKTKGFSSMRTKEKKRKEKEQDKSMLHVCRPPRKRNSLSLKRHLFPRGDKLKMLAQGFLDLLVDAAPHLEYFFYFWAQH